MKKLFLILTSLALPLRAINLVDPQTLHLHGLSSTASAAVSAAGGYYASDDINSTLSRFDAAGNLVSVVSRAGDSAGSVDAPAGVDVCPAGYLWVADTNNNRVQAIAPDGSAAMVLTTAGADGPLSGPGDVAVGPQNRLYVADSGNSRIVVFDRTTGAYLFSWGYAGTRGSGALSNPMGLAVAGSQVLVADTGNARVQVFDLDGNYLTTFGRRANGAGGFTAPYDVAVDSNGRVWVTDNGTAAVQVFAADGSFLKGIGAGFDGFHFQDPTYFYNAPNGDLLMTDRAGNQLYIWPSTLSVSASPKTVGRDPSALNSAPLSVGPVPARAGEALWLKLPAAANSVHWQIFTADLRLVGEVQAGGSTISYNRTAELASGVYLSKIVMENGSLRRESLQKIVITR